MQTSAPRPWMTWLLAMSCATALSACGDPIESDSNDLESFSFLAADNSTLAADVHATIVGDDITATVPFGADVPRLVARFTTTGASVTVEGVPQTSGETSNDFTRPIVYRVRAGNGTKRDFTATVRVLPSTAYDLTAFAFLGASNPTLAADVTATIVDDEITATVPFGTDVSALVATFTTTGARVTVGGTLQTSGQTPNDFRSPVVYRVAAPDDNARDYTVTVTIAPNAAKELTSFQLRPLENPQLTGPVFATISGTNIALTAPFGTGVTGLRATFTTTGASVTVGLVSQLSGQTPNDFTNPIVYRVTAVDGTTKDFTVTVTVALNPAKEITSFRFAAAGNPVLPADVTATIDGTAITATVPLGTDRTALVATFVHTGAIVTVGGAAQTSGQTPNDLRGPVVYRVTALDGTTKDFTVIIVIAPSSETFVKASNPNVYELFGAALALSADGTTLAIGAVHEDSAAAGVGGDQADNSLNNAGAVYVFTRASAGATWALQAYVKASNPGAGDNFGFSLALSADGNTLAVGSVGENSNATGINGNQANETGLASGAVYVFTRTGTTWTQQAYVKTPILTMHAWFGYSLALSADGNTLAVGASREDSNATGVGGDGNNSLEIDSGAVYVYTRAGTTWSHQAFIKASNTESANHFGFRLTLSADGNTLAVSAPAECSTATGIGGNQASTSAGVDSGAVYVFTRAGVTWAQQAYVKASNTGAGDEFGSCVALSADASTLVVGAPLEDSGAVGVGGNQLDNFAPDRGAAYVFTRTGTTWTQQAYVKSPDVIHYRHFGMSCGLSANGTTLAVGAPSGFATVGVPYPGAAYLYTRAGTTWSLQAPVLASVGDPFDNYGVALALASDGKTLVVGADGEDSAATGVGGNQADNSMSYSGAVYVYR